MTFKALRIDKTSDGTTAAIVDFDEAALMPGNVTVRVTHSTVNYKDGLAITGKSPVVRVSPMIGGIDFAGIVETSEDPEFHPGDAVVLNGWGLGETHFGGYAEKARVKGEWLIKLPPGLSAHDAMAIGTAGYTAMLSVIALEHHGLTPAQGPAIVTGAAGGVGSFALMLLKKAGWHLIASTGRVAEADYLKALGADEIIDRAELSAPGKPLGKERWIAGVDSVGSHTLVNLVGADIARRGHCVLRSRARPGLSRFRGTVHPAWRGAAWDRQRLLPEGAADRGLGASLPRS
jgi:acrylyl-CoA reductase (NADPH)